MRFVYFLLAGFLFASVSANAQIVLGPEVGVNLCNYTGKTDNQVRTGINSFTFGGIMGIELSSHFSVLPGLFYAKNGYTSPYRGQNLYVGISTFELPLSISYRIGPPAKVMFFVGIGGYGGVNWDGIVRLTGTLPSSHDLSVGYGAADDIKRYDAGVNGWAAAQVLKGLYVRAEYQQSLFNLNPQPDQNKNVMTNTDIRVSVGYIFRVSKIKTEPEEKKVKKTDKDKNKEKSKREKRKEKRKKRRRDRSGDRQL